MDKISHDAPSLEQARRHMRALFDAFSEAANVPLTMASELVADDRAFASRFRRANLTFATFDRVVGRFSWLWPTDRAWPAGVPRFAPVKPSEKALSKFRDRERKLAAATTPTTLPGDAVWPDDIPMPGRTAPTTENRNG